MAGPEKERAAPGEGRRREDSDEGSTPGKRSTPLRREPPEMPRREPQEPPPIGAELAPGMEGAAGSTEVIRLSDVQPERVEWLWAGRLPLGKMTLLDGDPGLGKSTMTLDMIARVTTGEPMPEDPRGRPPAGALIVSSEDGLADTIRPRLDAAGADVSRVGALVGVRDEEGRLRPPALPADIEAIEGEAMTLGARLIVIDPLMAYLGGGVDSHRDQDIRRALMPLGQMAERVGAAVLIVRHLNKSGGRAAIYRGGGSIGIVGAARMGLLAARDPDDETGRILAPTKSNLAAPAPALRWRLVDAGGVGRVEWLGEAEGVTADQLVAERKLDDGDERTAAETARELLLDLMGDARSCGRVEIRDAARLAEEQGLGRSAAAVRKTLQRAAAELGWETRREGFGRGSRCYWEAPAPHSGHTERLSTMDETGGVAPGNAAESKGHSPPAIVDTPIVDKGACPVSEPCPDCGATMAAPGEPGCLCDDEGARL